MVRISARIRNRMARRISRDQNGRFAKRPGSPSRRAPGGRSLFSLPRCRDRAVTPIIETSPAAVWIHFSLGLTHQEGRFSYRPEVRSALSPKSLQRQGRFSAPRAPGARSEAFQAGNLGVMDY